MTRGVPPACVQCGSYERHRIIRTIYNPLRPELRGLRALQFAPDAGIDPSWFATFAASVYGAQNSLDMIATGLPEGAYDLIISNHVLEHVGDHLSALREMVRVVGARGVVHLNVPSPTLRWETLDWGFADPEKNLHFRDYGADLAMMITKTDPRLSVMAAAACDAVTGMADIVFFFSLDAEALARFSRYWRGADVAVVRIA